MAGVVFFVLLLLSLSLLSFSSFSSLLDHVVVLLPLMVVVMMVVVDISTIVYRTQYNGRPNIIADSRHRDKGRHYNAGQSRHIPPR